jgi:hypothetical protein
LWEGWGQAAAAVVVAVAACQPFQDRPNGEVVIPLEHQGVWVGLQRECFLLVQRVNMTTGLLVRREDLMRREDSTQVATSVADQFLNIGEVANTTKRMKSLKVTCIVLLAVGGVKRRKRRGEGAGSSRSEGPLPLLRDMGDGKDPLCREMSLTKNLGTKKTSCGLRWSIGHHVLLLCNQQ